MRYVYFVPAIHHDAIYSVTRLHVYAVTMQAGYMCRYCCQQEMCVNFEGMRMRLAVLHDSKEQVVCYVLSCM